MTRLYLVEDHAIVREGLRAVLEASDFEVVGEAETIAVAMADIPLLRPDLVLLDLGLGARSGLDLLARLQGLDLPTRVLVLTVSDRPHDVSEALRLGACGYLLKGASGQEVASAIRAALQGQRTVTSSVAAMLADGSVGAAAETLSSLSARERQIMRMVVNGQSSASIASDLDLSPKTVDTYRSRLMAKLGVHEVTGLVRLAVRMGVIDGKPG